MPDLSYGRSYQRAAEQRRADIAQTERASIKQTTVFGIVRVKGSGEVLVDFEFPVEFVEKPFFTFGADLASNHAPEAGAFPVHSATVSKWELLEKSEQRRYYVGCTLAIVALGAENQRVNINCVFQGKAFRSPTSSQTDVDSGI